LRLTAQLVQNLCGYLIRLGKIPIKHDSVPANEIDRSLDDFALLRELPLTTPDDRVEFILSTSSTVE
jgi:hypothetical protein